MSERPAGDQPVQLNYVIPQDLDQLLEDYCKLTLISPSALVRSLIAEFVDGDRPIDPDTDHPRGRRTTVALPGRLLRAFEAKIQDEGHKTKAAVIGGLLQGYLPNRVSADTSDTVRVEVSLPTEISNYLFRKYGPGPAESLILRALDEFVSSDQISKETT